MLMGYGGLKLPYDVPANEYVNMETQKISTSRNWVINLKDATARYDADAIRYALSAIMPETSDSNITWCEFVRRNNDELVATFGNLVHRVLSMIQRNYNGVVPEPYLMGGGEKQIKASAYESLKKSSSAIENCKFREGLGSAMALAQLTNRYLDEKAPWKALKENPQSASTTLYTALNIINCLKILFYPYMPFAMEKLHAMLGLEGTVISLGWTWEDNSLPAGHNLGAIQRLFTKLDDSAAEEETSRLGVS